MAEPVFSIVEAAKVVGKSPRRMQIKAKEEGWISVAVPGKKWRRFPLTQFPADWQMALREHTGWSEPAGETPAQQEAAEPLPMPEVRRDRRDPGPQGPKRERVAAARLEIMGAVKGWCEAQGISKMVDCELAFATAYNRQEVDLPDWVYQHVKSTSRASIKNWWSRLKKGTATSLNPQSGRHRREKYIIEETKELRDFCVGVFAEFPHIGVRQMWRGMQARFRDRPEIKIPSESSVQRWFTWWRNAYIATYTYIKNPDEWRNKFAQRGGSYSEGIERPNQRWELDSTIGDVMLQDAKGNIKRYALVGCIDVFTRRARLLVAETSSSNAIVALLRRCIVEWGVPEAIKTDNGADYTSQYVTHVRMALGFEQIQCAPYSPQQKPHIERFFGTFTRDLLELLPGYVGHNVSDRKAIEAQRSWASRFGKSKQIESPLRVHQFQQFCDDYCQHIYGKREHGTTGLMPELATAGFSKRVVEDESILDLLMLPGGEAVVQGNGIRKHHHIYQLKPQTVKDYERLIGQKVHIRMPDDLGVIYIYEDATCEALLGIAECPELLGKSAYEMALENKAFDANIKRAASAAKLLGRNVDAKQVKDEIVAALMEGAENILAFPQAKEPHRTKAVETVVELQKAAKPKELPVEDADVAEARHRAFAEEQAREADEAARREWQQNRDKAYFRCWRSLVFGDEKSVKEHDWEEMATFLAGTRGQLPDYLLDHMQKEPLPEAAWNKLTALAEEVKRQKKAS